MKLRTKPNWSEAFQAYCTPTMDGQYKSYADIAFEYDICIRTVERIGSKDKWFERRCEVGISKNSKYLKERYDISVEVYNRLFKEWFSLMDIYGKTIKESLYGQNRMTPHEMLLFTRGFSIVTDQLLKIVPKPTLPQEKDTVKITKEDQDLVNRFLGKD